MGEECLDDSGSGSTGPQQDADTMGVGTPPVQPRREEGATPVGANISRYVVLEEIGRGGMGRVLRAYDPKLQREVALKEVRGEMLGVEATRRLITEARAMAKLSHPGVVAVYDVEETPDAQVVLVMEYVPGQTLKEWLTETERPWREIVDTFVSAGRGLAAAHEAGLLHRDFKPANVLIGNTVKVTDFGIAKTAGETSASMPDSRSAVGDEERTQTGIVLGTPRYMAPEQHRPGRSRSGMNNPLTPAADQYAFCVALWEALNGAPPFAGAGMATAKEEGPPPWMRNHSAPRAIVDAVTRGLSPDPTDRWPSMEALLQAIAWDPARRRSRRALALGTVGALGLAGVTWQSWASARADRCTGASDQLVGVWDEPRQAEVRDAILGIGKSYATRVWERTELGLDEYAAAWTAMHTESCEATTIRGEQSAEVMDLRMACLHRAVVDLDAVTAQLADADADVVKKAHRIMARLRPLDRCADVEALRQDVEPPLPEEADRVEAIRAQVAAAWVANEAGRYSQAHERVEAAKAMLADVAYGPVQTEVAVAEAKIMDALGEYEEAEAVLNRALESAARWRQWPEMGSVARQLMFVVGNRHNRMEEALRYSALVAGLAAGKPRQEATWRTRLGNILYAQGKYEDAEVEHRLAVELSEKALGPDHPDAMGARSSLAAVLRAQGKIAEAEAEVRRVLAVWEPALGPDHPDVASLHNNIGLTLAIQERYAEAETELQLALTLWERSLGPDHPDVSAARGNLALLLNRLGKHAEAEAQFRRALAIKEKTLGPDHPNVASSHDNLGHALHAQQRYEEAEAEHRHALALRERTLGPEHPDTAAARNNLGNVLRSLQRYEEAEVEIRRALAVQEKTLSPEHPSVATARSNLGHILYALGRYEEAEAEERRALAAWEKAVDPDHSRIARSRHGLAMMRLKLGDHAEAAALAEQAWSRRQRDDIAPERQAETAFVLAQALWGTGDRTRARELAEQALRRFAKIEDSHAEQAGEVRAWLQSHQVRGAKRTGTSE